jgi:endogenous inhibitor of DNA gyrase (YacG/DUF329 family)
VKKVPCPCCGKPALFSPENKWRPFCCERCKTIDLGDWAAERYRVASEEKLEDSPEKGSEQISSESPPKNESE